MKENDRIIADKDRNHRMQNSKRRNPVHSDNRVDNENIEKIKKFLMKKLSNGPVIKKADKNGPHKHGKANKKQGSHSLSQLHFFQNHHK